MALERVIPTYVCVRLLWIGNLEQETGEQTDRQIDGHENFPYGASHALQLHLHKAERVHTHLPNLVYMSKCFGRTLSFLSTYLAHEGGTPRINWWINIMQHILVGPDVVVNAEQCSSDPAQVMQPIYLHMCLKKK